jgi:hypothetical protein
MARTVATRSYPAQGGVWWGMWCISCEEVGEYAAANVTVPVDVRIFRNFSQQSCADF